MSNIFILLGLIILSVFIVLVSIRLFNDKTLLLYAFKKNNVIVYGKKGTGKDLIFNYVINHRRVKCCSNIQFNKKYCDIQNISDFELRSITYNDLIDNTFDKQDKTFIEKKDFYISDAGIYLPSQYSALLDKKYKSFPIVYALSRHLGQFNIHANAQALGRVWNKLREQADSFISCRRTYKIFGFLITKCIYYDKYESANSNLLPFRAGSLSSKEKKALKAQFEATNGVVRTLYILQYKRNIKYDTRAFHEIIFGYKAPQKVARIRKIFKKGVKKV